MLPNLFPVLRDSAPVAARITSGDKLKFYRHGAAPMDVAGEYITQQPISILPENTIDGEVPRVDGSRVTLSCWSDNAGGGSKGIESLAKAVRDAIEPYHDILDMRDMGQDEKTKRYRIDLDVSVWNDR